MNIPITRLTIATTLPPFVSCIKDEEASKQSAFTANQPAQNNFIASTSKPASTFSQEENNL